MQKHSIGTKKNLSASEINRFNFLAVSLAQGTFLPTRSAKAQHRDKENAFCIRNKPFLFLAVSLAQGTFLPTRSAKAQLRDKENAFCIRNKPFLFFSGFFCTGNVFCPLAVIYYSFGTKKTLSASEINRFYSLAVSFAQGTFLPTRSAKAQLRDKENAFCIRNKPFLFFSGFSCTGNVFAHSQCKSTASRQRKRSYNKKLPFVRSKGSF